MNYGAEDIQTLDFRDAIRTRVEMYMGSADNQGVLQCIREIISNSIDEAIMGYGNKIKVEVFKDNRIRITDQGRGCPFGKREDGTEALEAIFMTPHSGGKFSEKTYDKVIGMNGIGGKGVALSAEECFITSSRGGKRAELRIEKGFKKSFEIKDCPMTEHGTMVEFIPSQEVYRLEIIDISIDEILNMCKSWSYLNKGIEFHIIDNIAKKEWNYLSQNGIIDMVKEKINKPIHENIIHYVINTDGGEAEIALCWTKEREKSFVFTNGLHNTEGGTSLTGLKTSITRNMNKILGKNFSGEIIRTGLVYAISCKIKNPSFANQTKTKINNPELRQLADKAFSEVINLFKERFPADIKAIGNFLSREEKAEAAAEKARLAVLENQKVFQQENKKKTVLAGKLVDCRLHDSTSQLLVVEGKSALGGIVKARDSEHTAAFPLRGKLINCLKNNMEDIVKNEEIRELQLALGCPLGEYSERKLRYGRVVIMSDADVDGYSIMCLVLTFFYRFYPQMIKEGKIFWGKTPLFKVITKGKNYYAYNEEELSKLPKGDVVRLKGLGESEPEDFRDTIFSKDGKYIQFTMDDAEEADRYFNMLLGDDIGGRRDYIFSNVDFESLDD